MLQLVSLHDFAEARECVEEAQDVSGLHVSQ